MGKPHVPIERDIAEFIRRYRENGGDPGEILVTVGRTFPDASFGAVGRALALADQPQAGGSQ